MPYLLCQRPDNLQLGANDVHVFFRGAILLFF